MAECPFCKGFRDDSRECQCLGEYNADLLAKRIPPGLTPGAFTYRVWRDVRELEDIVRLHPEFGEEWGEQKLAEIVAREEADYQKIQRNVATIERERERLASRPRRPLY